MKHRWEFFKEPDSSFGLFYPMHYTVAAFDTDDRAEYARQRCLEAGFADDDVATASGPFVINRLESMKGANWLDRIEAGIARVVGTEAGYIQDDVKLARRGGAFLFVYTPEQGDIDRLRGLLKRLHPIFARRYHAAGIEAICYPPQSTL